MNESTANATPDAHPNKVSVGFVDPPKASGIQSLNSQVRAMLTDCTSKQSLFDRVLEICVGQFPTTVGRVDFRIGDKDQQRITHDPRMAKSLAERFSNEYMQPVVDAIRATNDPEPKIKRYERGEQKMTLLCAPVMDIAHNKAEGIITLMLGGGSYKPEVVLPRLDGIVAASSAVLLVKSRSDFGNAIKEDVNAPASAPLPTAAASTAIQDSSALAKASQFASTKEFGYSIVNSLCGQVKAEQVSFGVEKNQRIEVEAISGVPDFKASSPGVAIVRQAMEECLDHGSATVAQHDKIDDAEMLPIHRQWAADSNNSCVCSIPLKQGDVVTGVISIRRPASRPFQQEEIASLLQLLSPYGAALRVVEKANRSMRTQLKTSVRDSAKKNLSHGTMGRKAMFVALTLGLLWFLFGSMTYRPICRTRVMASNLRHFSAPFDGKLQQVHVRPGQEVKQGDLLAQFDTVDLRLELNALTRQMSASDVELRQAMHDGDLSLAALAKSRIGVLQSQAAAVENQIQDASIVAPNDGTVVLSDLEQRIGQIFPQGEEILQFAPEGDWLLEIEIPDDIANYVTPEQVGTFAAASSPTEIQPFTIQHVDGAAMTVQDRNVFIARAPLESHPEWMRSGMEGTSRVVTVSRPVWWVTMHRVVDWARVNFWM